ncbi:hypothetical protein B0H21DRAFT_147599 [Amylocystis lapponica]|nr:hypothetical protein B0H21DRAFT_147599 [Amylocystis lapponica]
MAYNSSYTPQTVETVMEKNMRHPKYYLQGGDIHFQVENFLFRVHRYFFERESAWFREKLAVPAPAGQNPRGSSDMNPYVLDDVPERDFSRFLWVFYNPKYSIYDANVEDWSVILKMSYDWRFPEVKRLACRELEKFEIAPLHKIELYQMYEVDRKLLIPSYIAMCARTEPISPQEGRRLSLETALLLASAREMARGTLTAAGPRSPLTVQVEDDDMVTIIKDVFGLTNGPPSPSLTPLETPSGRAAFVGSPTTSPSRRAREPAAAMQTPGFPPQYQSFPSASATAVNSVFGGGDVFSPTGTSPAAPNGTGAGAGTSAGTGSGSGSGSGSGPAPAVPVAPAAPAKMAPTGEGARGGAPKGSGGNGTGDPAKDPVKGPTATSPPAVATAGKPGAKPPGPIDTSVKNAGGKDAPASATANSAAPVIPAKDAGAPNEKAEKSGGEGAKGGREAELVAEDGGGRQRPGSAQGKRRNGK